MLEFPIELPAFRYQSTFTRPVIESASRVECLARTRFTPKNFSYETIVQLKDGVWSVTTMMGSRELTYGEDYPVARGHQIALIVINWWQGAFPSFRSEAMPTELVIPRATWLARAAHKLLTEVGDTREVVGALRILASGYGVDVGHLAAPAHATLKAATWAAAAHRHLDREVPTPQRQTAVALLTEMITGVRQPLGEDPPSAVAA